MRGGVNWPGEANTSGQILQYHLNQSFHLLILLYVTQQLPAKEPFQK